MLKGRGAVDRCCARLGRATVASMMVAYFLRLHPPHKITGCGPAARHPHLRVGWIALYGSGQAAAVLPLLYIAYVQLTQAVMPLFIIT
jgi:hypothetical protein